MLEKKYHKLSIDKTIVDNYNTSFVLLLIAAIFFFTTSLLKRQEGPQIQTNIESTVGKRSDKSQDIVLKIN